MPQHYLIRYDQIGDAALREAKRGEHIAYRQTLGDALTLAGPILDEDDTPVGSVIIVAAEDATQARHIATEDPFVQAGLLTLASLERIRVAAMRLPSG